MTHRPTVITFDTASLDGRLTIAPDVLLLYGDERWPVTEDSSGAYRQILDTFKPQVTLEGSGSFILEGMEPEPLPPVEGDPAPLYKDFLPEAVLNRPNQDGWFTIVDGRGRVRWLYTGEPGKGYPGMEGWHLLVCVGHHTPPEYLAYLRRENVPYLVAGSGHVDLITALEKLSAKLGVERVLSTAGGRLNGALLRAGLVDEVNVEFFPGIIGGPETPALFDAPALQPGEWPTRLTLLACQQFDNGHVWLRYRVNG
jgi:2,5-diamino-6-(ribosylamino)-4(3H)-pyrimidinone 5'-phosphate reductase